MEHIFNIVNSMCLDNRFSVPSIPRLTLWFLQFSAFLQNLLETTRALESNSSTIDNVPIAMDYILSLFEEGKEQYKDDEIMASCFNAGWAKMDKYYNMTYDTPVYAAAIVLNPSNKWEYFENEWKDHPNWLATTKSAVKGFWDIKYRPVGMSSTPPEPRQKNPNLPPNQFTKWKHARRSIGCVFRVSFYDHYQS